uniref:Integrin alpha-2 domain-containing protein n=1 Tax=Callorhinchus milii TaxID=7868 RepID=A0A4W3GS42_CALMI
LPLALFVTGLAAILCFNIETENPYSFKGEEASHFGYSLSQLDTGTEKWTIVGAPLHKQGSNTPGAIYKCGYQTTCNKISTRGNSTLRKIYYSLPLSL